MYNEVFNEFHHAYIPAFFYDEVKKAFGEQGIRAFIKATNLYGEQRGNRMALRALREGYDLSYNSYFLFGEWRGTPGFAKIERTFEDGVLLSENFVCPWYSAMKEVGLTECGAVYCQYIDTALVRGFNPELKFEARTVLHTSDTCKLYYHIGEPITPIPDGDYNIKLDMEYHCAHIFWTFSRVFRTVFGAKAEPVIAAVKKRFAEKASPEMLDTLLSYQDCDFTYLPDEETYADLFIDHR